MRTTGPSRRRLILAMGGALLAPAIARGQQPKRLALFLRASDPEAALREFRERQADSLVARGWIEGKTLGLELHLVDDVLERYPEAARRLVATRPDAIWTNTWFLARALQAATTTIPIVAVIGDPVGAGLAKSLTAPGGNVTGISLALDVAAMKQGEMLRQLLPGLRVLYYFEGDMLRGKSLDHRPAGSLPLLDAELARERPKLGTAALAVPIWLGGARSMTDGYRDLAQLALRHRLPSVGWNREFVDAGGLCCYSLEYRVEDRPRVAAIFDRVLRGGDPARIPFEMPTHALLGINRKTASALGITLPAEWLLRANFVVA